MVVVVVGRNSKKKIPQMACLVSYDSSNSLSDDDVTVLEDSTSSKKQRCDDVLAGHEPDDVFVPEICSAQSDDEEVGQPALRRFGGEGFDPDLPECELSDSAETAGPPEVGNVSERDSCLSLSNGTLGHRPGKKNPYALSQDDLDPGMRVFLRAVRQFFTQKVNLQRQKAPLSNSTYMKAQERMLCKYCSRINIICV